MLIPCSNVQRVQSYLAGELDVDPAELLERAVLIAELLVAYAIALAGRPSLQ